MYIGMELRVMAMVFNATFNNISVIKDRDLARILRPFSHFCGTDFFFKL
jgi:hypothetical protein